MIFIGLSSRAARRLLSFRFIAVSDVEDFSSTFILVEELIDMRFSYWFSRSIHCVEQ
jgi:hypothetical protein